MTKQYFENIIAYLREITKDTIFENHLYCVGGAMRDYVMGNEIKDIDLVLDIENGGILFAEWMESNGHTKGSVVTYPTYGTAMFRLKEFSDIEIECVQTRKEQYKDKNSRNPETTFGSIYEDAMRRDLTINALYYHIGNDEILDVTGKGVEDIKNHIIRVTSTPEIVFFDDGLRLLRTCRFSSRFGWEIEKTTYDGMVKNVDRLSTITKERIQDELNKMLMCDRPIMALKLMKDIGLLKYVIPELVETIGLEQNKYHFGDVWKHTLKVLEIVSLRPYWGASSLELRMAALLHDIGKITTRSVDENGNVHFYKHELASYDLCERILRRLKYSNDFISEVKFLVKNHMRTKQFGNDCSKMKDKTLRKLQYECGHERFFDLMTLIDADNKAHAVEYCLPDQVYYICKKTNEMVDSGEDMFDYQLPIDGNDVMEIKNIKPCKEVKECLEYAMKLAFNKPKITREELIKHVKGYKLKH